MARRDTPGNGEPYTMVIFNSICMPDRPPKGALVLREGPRTAYALPSVEADTLFQQLEEGRVSLFPADAVRRSFESREAASTFLEHAKAQMLEASRRHWLSEHAAAK